MLPNNSNIILAAEQSAEIYEKAKIHVIPAKNIGAGYVAISSSDFENQSTEEITETMLSAIERITTGYLSPAVRDADINGIHITSGDTIGIIGKEIVVSEHDKKEAIYALIKTLVKEDSAMITAFYGKDSTEKEREIITSYIAEAYPYAEFYFIEGGQEIAPYIFVVE